MSARMKIPAEGFVYSRAGRGSELRCERVPLTEIAARIGTPTFVYSKRAIEERVRRLRRLIPDCAIYFAAKACGNIHVLRLLGKAGCGADIVSGGELFRAGLAGISPKKIVFSGVGKTQGEILEALKAGIHLFNVESLGELLTIERIAYREGIKTKAALRINPNIHPKTHPHISTGLRGNKFGLSRGELEEVYRVIPRLRRVRVCGLSCHIGSQITSAEPLEQAWRKLLEETARAPFDATHLDLGGGLGISYAGEKTLSLERYASLIRRVFRGKNFALGIEPGRAILGPTAILLTSAVSVKKRGAGPRGASASSGRSFLVVDAAMNDLARPALYGAVHPIFAVERAARAHQKRFDVVGPVCESADAFESGALLAEPSPGSLFAISNCGAYAMSMSSQYNARPRAAEVLVEGARYRVIRERETYADLVERELL